MTDDEFVGVLRAYYAEPVSYMQASAIELIAKAADRIERLDAENAALREALKGSLEQERRDGPATVWRPIETAPTAIKIDVWVEGRRFTDVSWNGLCWMQGASAISFNDGPMYWMSPPGPPA